MKMGCSCGIPSPDECQAMHYAALIWETENNDYAVHRLHSFTYGLQHPDRYLISAKTFATHLLGVCIGVEYHNDQKLFDKVLQTFDWGKNVGELPPILNKSFLSPFQTFTHIIKL
ncbi:MAG TPA: DUF5946 family protein [Bacillota bacterium]|nr:DUF5946 family protein [Bacillota bacterium]